MSDFDSSKDYYDVLGAHENATRSEIERLYKRLAARRHPDRGGSEEEMKSLNEAYRVLKNESVRRDYDSQREKAKIPEFVPRTSPTASDVGLFGQGLSAFLCLSLGLFLLFLVRFQFIWFLWPLAILAAGVILFGVLLAHAAMLTFSSSLPSSHALSGRVLIWEALFWATVGVAGYALYWLLSEV